MKLPADRLADLRLFCFPYAGGGASVFRSWTMELAPAVQVCPLRLPGRESRITEAPLTSVAAMARTIAEEIRPFLGSPFAFLGYSLGSLVAFETARLLSREGIAPTRLIVSALRAPHIPRRARSIHALPPSEFAKEISDLKGTPEPVLRNAELMNLVLPSIQADFQAYETYDYRPQQPLQCPITAMGGTADNSVNQDELAAWREHTAGEFKMRMLPGGHFFLHSSRRLLLWAVAQDLRARLSVACG